MNINAQSIGVFLAKTHNNVEAVYKTAKDPQFHAVIKQKATVHAKGFKRVLDDVMAQGATAYHDTRTTINNKENK